MTALKQHPYSHVLQSSFFLELNRVFLQVNKTTRIVEILNIIQKKHIVPYMTTLFSYSLK